VSAQRQSVAALAAAAFVVAGCGSSSHGDTTVRVTTVPTYAGFPAETITVASGDPRSPTCGSDARSFARTARVYAIHAGPDSAVPPDTYYLVMREELADFQVRRCDPALLGAALASLPAWQRRTLRSDLPQEMVAAIRRGLAAAGS
jgi:hypothetical protein